MVDKELIGIRRDSLKPSISLWLLNTNYEEMGEQDKEEFERDFDEILDLALIGLKYKTQLSREGTTKDATSDTISRQAAIDAIVGCTTIKSEEGLREYVEEHLLKNRWSGGILAAINAVKDLPSVQPEPERTMEEFMYGQDAGNPEDGSL